MFEFVKQPMLLKYVGPDSKYVTNAGTVQFGEDWYDDWLDGLVKSEENLIFFLVVESTDVFEEDWEWDFNTVVYHGDDSVVTHTASAECPPGCFGQFEDCQYKLETNDE